MHMSTQSGGSTRGSAPDRVLELKGERGHTPPSLTQMRFIPPANKIQFLQGSLTGKQTALKGRPNA